MDSELYWISKDPRRGSLMAFTYLYPMCFLKSYEIVTYKIRLAFPKYLTSLRKEMRSSRR